jgi:hypothetical protein
VDRCSTDASRTVEADDSRGGISPHRHWTDHAKRRDGLAPTCGFGGCGVPQPRPPCKGPLRTLERTFAQCDHSCIKRFLTGSSTTRWSPLPSGMTGRVGAASPYPMPRRAIASAAARCTDTPSGLAYGRVGRVHLGRWNAPQQRVAVQGLLDGAVGEARQPRLTLSKVASGNCRLGISHPLAEGHSCRCRTLRSRPS